MKISRYKWKKYPFDDVKKLIEFLNIDTEMLYNLFEYSTKYMIFLKRECVSIYSFRSAMGLSPH